MTLQDLMWRSRLGTIHKLLNSVLEDFDPFSPVHNTFIIYPLCSSLTTRKPPSLPYMCYKIYKQWSLRSFIYIYSECPNTRHPKYGYIWISNGLTIQKPDGIVQFWKGYNKMESIVTENRTNCFQIMA
jgi:hypothetical protein